MASGCLGLLLLGPLYWLFEKAHQQKNKELDRVEISPHTWMGMSGKTRYNRRYLGPIKIKTFLSTSKLMVSKVNDYEIILNKLLYDDSNLSEQERENLTVQMSELNKKIIKYMRQIDRRKTLRCYAEWKENYSKSYLAYINARIKAIELDSKLEEVKKIPE